MVEDLRLGVESVPTAKQATEQLAKLAVNGSWSTAARNPQQKEQRLSMCTEASCGIGIFIDSGHAHILFNSFLQHLKSFCYIE